ncbi:MAG: ABC transporter ATP-binding protein [Armatimonadetes bacterium]|nr:ABC transporter ATP-binding protein [Armatimonadota bacterium]
MNLSVDLSVPLEKFVLRAAFELRGKTTSLDCIAGLRRPQAGHILLDGDVLFDRDAAIDLPVAERRVGYVFQDPSLFPHLSAYRNVAYPLKARGVRDRARVEDLLERFGLAGYRNRLPEELSGGEQQRLAVARALAAGPRLLLLDEPFGALDAAARPIVRGEVLKVLEEQGIPSILVTHSFEEALGFGPDVVVMEQGSVVQWGPAAELLTQPTSPFAAALAGVNHWVGRVEPGAVEPDHYRVRVGAVAIVVVADQEPVGQVALALAPDEIHLAADPPLDSRPNRFRLVVESLAPEGAAMRVRLGGPLNLTALCPTTVALDEGFAVGGDVTASFEPAAVRLC